MNIKLIVGLGNPGKEYSANRHNIGFHCLNYFAKQQRIEFSSKQCKSRIGMGKADGLEVVLAKPQTYMNASGESVNLLLRKYRLGLDDLVVIHDDLDLPLGKIRIKRDNSAGGHNGIKSIIACLESQDFTRIRVGIGRPETPDEAKDHEIIDYVLTDFSREEKIILDQTIRRVSEALLTLLAEGLEAAMNGYN
jgi:peptidyl-tRNA hydrolase, PTH1 family